MCSIEFRDAEWFQDWERGKDNNNKRRRDGRPRGEEWKWKRESSHLLRTNYLHAMAPGMNRARALHSYV